jgi:hypothetical protein
LPQVSPPRSDLTCCAFSSFRAFELFLVGLKILESFLSWRTTSPSWIVVWLHGSNEGQKLHLQHLGERLMSLLLRCLAVLGVFIMYYVCMVTTSAWFFQESRGWELKSEA